MYIKGTKQSVDKTRTTISVGNLTAKIVQFSQSSLDIRDCMRAAERLFHAVRRNWKRAFSDRRMLRPSNKQLCS